MHLVEMNLKSPQIGEMSLNQINLVATISPKCISETSFDNIQVAILPTLKEPSRFFVLL